MGLYLVRHGEAAAEEVDPNRPLTPRGKADVLKTAAFLKGKVTVDIIWHSTKLRARETASLYAGAFSPAHGLLEKQGLAPNDPVGNIMDDIINTKHEHLMIVGHLPFLSRLASLLIAGTESGNVLVFRPGGVAYLEHTDKGNWSAVWIVVPELV
ncbi:MAG: phosphohistidine phosphatase SixA [Spirochaetes bacterium]|nr:phosphohistidine phosphatase SixA [Spirochaetota bacterium]